MLLACLTNSYGRFGPVAAFEYLPQAGITNVELPIKNAGVPSFFGETPLLNERSRPAEAEHVLDLARKHGITLCSCNITSGNLVDPAVVDRTLAKLDVAAALGVSLVVGGGGDPSSPDEAAKLWGHLRRVGDTAAALGITYCCETHPGACQNVDRMLETMQAVDHSHVRINFDTGNLFYYNTNVDFPDSLRWIAPWVRHVHLKDTPGGFEQWHFVELGSGIVDFRQVREILAEAGFQGPFSLEIEGISGEPEQSLDQLQQRIVSSVEHLRGCGY